MPSPAPTPSRVAEVVWPWREGSKTGNSGPSRGHLRRKALVQVMIMCAVGLLLERVFGHLLAARIVWSLACAVAVLGLISPNGFLSLEQGLKRFGGWVGSGLTWVLLVPFFYLCFVPSRIWLGITGKDPLRRTYDSTAESYWEPRSFVKNAGHYKKQY